MENTVNKNETNEEYTVQELLQQLIQDDSWEKDPEYRMKAVGTLMSNVFIHC